MRNTFNAVYYVGDVDVIVQFNFNYADGWRAVAVAASDEDWAEHSMQHFNELVLNKFTHVATDMGTDEEIAQELLQFVNTIEDELFMELASVAA